MGALDENRRHWDALAGVHSGGGEGDPYYDIASLVAGRRQLGEHEAAAVGDVDGADVLHVQCHIGVDSVLLARAGARVTGVDLSPASLAEARDIAQRCGQDVTFVEGDAADLPASLHDRFDIAYATIGVLCWIADVDAWMRSAAACLRPGGRLVLVDLHPLFNAVSSVEPFALDFPYAFDGPRRLPAGTGSYAAPDAVLPGTVEHGHALGEVVTAAVRAGLVVERLEEHLDTDVDPRGSVLRREDDGRYRLRVGAELLPVLYTLVARRA